MSVSKVQPGAGAPNAIYSGIVAILIAVALVSVNDMLVKKLSGGYPLHQIIFIRSCIGVVVALGFVLGEGGLSILRTGWTGLHLFRALLIVGANLFFFTGLAALPLAEATAIFFVAPLLIAILQAPILGEHVGPRRIAAIAVGFSGVLVMLTPGAGGGGELPWWTYLLPIAGAICYALFQIMTRLLGASTRASALSFQIQATFVVVGSLMWLAAGDGAFAHGVENPSLLFLLRAWVWPAPEDLWVFALIGVIVGCMGYAFSQAYRLGDPATIAPFEYVALPLAVFWGILTFGEWPDLRTCLGIALIAGSGIYVIYRQRRATRAMS